MDWNTGVLVVLFVGVAAVCFFGGSITVKKDSIKIDIDGLLKYLRAAAEEKHAPPPTLSEADVRKLGGRVSSRSKRLPAGKVLWVDDHPLNNQRERLALSVLGIFVDPYTNNTDAMEAFRREKYDVVISDVVRDGTRETGWDLAGAIRHGNENKNVPIIFYVGAIDGERQQRVHDLRANGITTRPDELVELITEHLR